MKLRCPRCQKKLTIPDKYAGKAIRCPACSRAFSVPKLTAGTGAAMEASKLDLEGLAGLERASTEMDERELAEASRIVAAQKEAKKKSSAKVRVCPNCNKPTEVKDPYADILCSHCWQSIPALVKGETLVKVKASRGGAAAFYGDFATAVTYPIPALAGLGSAAGIAIAAALAPVAIMTALTYVMAQGNVGLPGADLKEQDLSGIQWILAAIFGLEVLFYTAVALHVFLDTIRATVIGTQAPPNLGWTPAAWGKSFVGYFVLLSYYAVATTGILFVTYPGDLVAEIQKGEVLEIFTAAGTPFFIGMLVISFGVPMNLLGFGLGSVGQAINPIRVFKSIGRTHVHYIFLVLLLSVYGILFASAFLAIVFDWFIPQIGEMMKGAGQGNMLQVALALVAWGVVMAFYFYGNYVLARLHGIFAQSFRKDLLFGTM